MAVTLKLSDAAADELYNALNGPPEQEVVEEFGPFLDWGEREWSRTVSIRREFLRDLATFKRLSEEESATPFVLPTYYMVAFDGWPVDPQAGRALAMNTGANAEWHYGKAYTIKPPEPSEPGIWRQDYMLPDTVAINELVIPDADTLYKAIRGRIIRARESRGLWNWGKLGADDIAAGS